MNKLIIEIGQYGRTVLGRVVGMPESLRSTGVTMTHATYGKYAIKSLLEPQLKRNTLFIGGTNKSVDNHEFVFQFDNVEDATTAITCIEYCVRTINQMLEEQVTTQPTMNIPMIHLQ